MRNSYLLGAICTAFLTLVTTLSHASVLLMDEGANLRNNGTGNFGGTVGVQFTVGSVPIQVTSLGIWDGPNPVGTEGDGLETATQVGLWTNDGSSLLASVSIAQGLVGSSVDGSSALSVFAPITPITLSANTTYRLGALYTSGGNSFTNGSGAQYDSAVNILAGVFASGGSLSFPGSADPNNLFGTATMQFTVVPVPATAWLFGSGLLGLIGIAKKKEIGLTIVTDTLTSQARI